MLSSIKRFMVTIAYLKPIQIYYRVYYFLRKIIRTKLNITYPFSLSSNVTTLVLHDSINSLESLEGRRFSFLNKSYQFKNDVDWNTAVYGKLWTYNLTYFDYLNQKYMPKEKGLELIHDFIRKMPDIKDGLEPFPISLRGINWIKFLIKHQLEDDKIDNSLYAQYFILMDNIEYHLLGNHLLENGFSLLFAAYYFKDDKLYAKAREILNSELEEQILSDGAHFELTPMYHQIMFFRVLDCINLLQNNIWKEDQLLSLLLSKASLMRRWLNEMTFSNGEMPLFNDSANGIAATTRELNTYADELGVKSSDVQLSASGYRKMKTEQYECVVDVGNIGPDYIPGHAHSDTFNFELYIKGLAFIVDTGTSTYETNTKRTSERSTRAHNTVMINNVEQSEVWGGFRVASRAKVQNIVEKKDYISAVHDGYVKKFDILHQREFFFHENSIRLVDTLHTNRKYQAIARIHFAPNIELSIEGTLVLCDGVEIHCSSKDISMSNYAYAKEFNKTIDAKMIEIAFNNTLELEIKI